MWTHSSSGSWRPCAANLLIGALVCLCFGSSLFGDFVFDDSEALLQNPDLKAELLSLDIFKHDFWGKELTDPTSHKSYRPLTILVFKCIRQLSTLVRGEGGGDGGRSEALRPQFYHAANLISYYLLCTVLHSTLHVFLVSRIIGQSAARARETALLVAVLFTVHPVHTEPVASCVGLADLLSALCCFLAFNVYLRTADSIFRIGSNCTIQTLAPPLFGSFAVVLLTGLGMLFKEQGITYLGIFAILNCVLLAFHTSAKRSCTRLVISLQLGIFLISASCLLYSRLWIMNFSSPSFSPLDNPASHVSQPLFRFINFGYIYLLNAFIIVCPIWLCHDWSMGCVALIESLDDTRILLLVAFTATLSVIFIYLLLSIRHIEKRCYLVCALFVLPFLPSSNLFFQVGFVIAERNLFTPLLGYSLVLAISYFRCLDTLPPPSSLKCIFHCCLYLLIIGHSTRSFYRTHDWLHESDLFSRDVTVCPKNAKIFYNIAKTAADSGLVDKAVENYRRALELNPNYTSPLNNYANILRDQGQLMQAKELLEKACTLDPQFAAGLMNLAITEMSLGNFAQSEMYFHRVISIRPKHAYSHYNMGNMYLESKRHLEAEQAYQKATELDSHLVRAWNNLILLKQNHNQPQAALQLATTALHFNPEAASLHFLAGNLFGQLEQPHASEQHFKRAIALSPHVAKYHYNLAVLYHRNKRYEQAKAQYQETLRLDPQHKGALQQLQVLAQIKVGTRDKQ